MAEFVKVCSVNDVKPGSAKRVSVEGKEIALFNVNGKVYAIGAVCTHAGGPLEEGFVDNNEVECPWHGAKFNVESGEATSPPASEPVTKYEVMIEGEDVKVKM